LKQSVQQLQFLETLARGTGNAREFLNGFFLPSFFHILMLKVVQVIKRFLSFTNLRIIFGISFQCGFSSALYSLLHVEHAVVFCCRHHKYKPVTKFINTIELKNKSLEDKPSNFQTLLIKTI
jgi:hypothetical protein